jgi:hypothetical protein
MFSFRWVEDSRRPKPSAAHAARTLPVLVAALEQHGQLPKIENTPARELLADVLAGDTINVVAREIAPDRLSDHLEKTIGSRIRSSPSLSSTPRSRWPMPKRLT